MRLIRVICIAAIAIAASSTAGWTQPAGSDPSFDRMRAKLKAGSHVTVDLQNGHVLEGRFVDAGPDALTVSTSAGERQVPRSDVARVQRHGHGVLLGAIIGGGLGFTAGKMLSIYYNNEGHDGDKALFGLTAVGLGVGIGLDALINNPHTVYRGAASRTTISMDAGPRRTAVHVVVGF